MQLKARQDILVMAGLSYAVSLSSCLSNFSNADLKALWTSYEHEQYARSMRAMPNYVRCIETFVFSYAWWR